jgi:hypothetical protein
MLSGRLNDGWVSHRLAPLVQAWIDSQDRSPLEHGGQKQRDNLLTDRGRSMLSKTRRLAFGFRSMKAAPGVPLRPVVGWPNPNENGWHKKLKNVLCCRGQIKTCAILLFIAFFCIMVGDIFKPI